MYYPPARGLGELEHALESKHKIYKLRDAIQTLTSQYERIYIDTPPAFNFFYLIGTDLSGSCSDSV